MPEFLACELEVDLILQSTEPAAPLPAWLCWMPARSAGSVARPAAGGPGPAQRSDCRPILVSNRLSISFWCEEFLARNFRGTV